MTNRKICTPKRQATFLAWVGHESGRDGQRYRGRGLIQVTGHDNSKRSMNPIFKAAA